MCKKTCLNEKIFEDPENPDDLYRSCRLINDILQPILGWSNFVFRLCVHLRRVPAGLRGREKELEVVRSSSGNSDRLLLIPLPPHILNLHSVH